MQNIPILRALVRSWRNEDGTASVEFILTLPILALWFIGSFIFFDVYRSNSQTEKVAFTISDIVSRYEDVTDTEMDDLFALQQKMLPPRVDRRWMRITSICYEDELYRVLWSYTNMGNDIVSVDPLTDETIPLGIMPLMVDQDSIILTEVYGRWRPLSSIVGIPEQIWTNRLVTRPRFVQAIPHATLNPNTLCPAAPPT